MKILDAIKSRRTIRAFINKPVERKLLENLVDAARLAPMAANRQPLEYVVIDDQIICNKVFPNIKLAGYLDWEPGPEQQPRAYIVIVANQDMQKSIWLPFDTAFAAENICLAAWGEGVGSCIVGAFSKDEISKLLNIPKEMELILMVALGYPAHKSEVAEMKNNGVEYWRDEDGTFHVPKRKLADIIHINHFNIKK